MKPFLSTLLAAATLGAVPAIGSAQTVSIYGRVDLSVTRQNAGTSVMNGSNGQLGAGDQGARRSRFTFGAT